MSHVYRKAAYVAAGWFLYNFALILVLEPLETFTMMFEKAEWFYNTFVCMAGNPIFLVANLVYLGWAATEIRKEMKKMKEIDGHSA